MIRTSTFLLLKLKGSLLVRSRAICSEAASCSRFEACAVADTIEVGAVEVSGVREDRERLIGHDNAQRSTSAVSETFLDTSENTGIGGLRRHANSSYECQSEDVKRIG
jgi:hypothetical protein